jgi:hypothetical protein
MVGDDEQGDSAADVRLEHAEQLFDLALESRPDVVNGGKKSACCHRSAFGRASPVPPASKPW